jgi:phosphoribosylanthranilate isomerase
MTCIKICGLTSVEDARKCLELGVEYLGLVLSDSPRRASVEIAAKICAEVGTRARVVGVFARSDDLLRFDAMTDIALDYYQVYFQVPSRLHRTPRNGWLYARFVETSPEPLPLTNGDLAMFDYKHLTPADMSRVLDEQRVPFADRSFLAGNLSVENVAEIVRRYRPFGVDVARGTERLPGVKDHDLLTRFVEAVRNADADANS